jgi:hypothetical protein
MTTSALSYALLLFTVQAVVQWAHRAAEGLAQGPATHLVEQLNADAASPASSIATWLKAVQSPAGAVEA